VHRIEDGMDRREVACTTYQMRNFYTQLRDGYFSRLDVFNYASHHQIARWAARGAEGKHVLDVCCGRGLLLPLLRYHAKEIGSYTGIDIKASNATWRHQRVTTGEPLGDGGTADYYPWPTYFVEGDVAEADTLVGEQAKVDGQPVMFDFIVYTAAIEHMHPEAGQASLHALRRLAAPGAELVLTCPNTPEDQDGYDTRYRAHVYEWKLSELRAGLAAAGWRVLDVWGLDIGLRVLQERMDADGAGHLLKRLREHVPPEWLGPALAPLYPDVANEVGLLAVPVQDGDPVDVPGLF
jgi:SAM-dependent methyltransferase